MPTEALRNFFWRPETPDLWLKLVSKPLDIPIEALKIVWRTETLDLRLKLVIEP